MWGWRPILSTHEWMGLCCCCWLHILIFSINLAKPKIFESLPSALFLTRSWSDIQSIALCCILSNAEFPRNWKFRAALVIVGELCRSKSLHHLLFSSVLRTFHTFLLLQIAIRVILTRIQYGPHPSVKKLSKQNFRRESFSFLLIFLG